ncbi:MAG: tRNA (adenosine(37)-N6)-threonylcarbamoyltransferase complex dimerization subunit type 1 TsaB [Desulfatibacillaceae bacterium]
MRILAVDTAAETYSVALAEDGVLVVEMNGNRARTHARHVMRAVEALYAQAGVGPKDLDGLAVTIGPGSFTGLRIGVATVQGLATALELDVAPVMTLDVLAAQAGGMGDTVWAAMDARRGQVYVARYYFTSLGMEKPEPEKALDPHRWLQDVAPRDLLVGDGVAAYRELVGKCMGPAVRVAPESANMPRAATVARLGQAVFERGAGLAPDRLEPVYLRQSDAEAACKKGHENR